MKIKQERIERPYAIKISVQDDGKEIGRGFLFILFNQLHDEPFGFMEDIYIEEEYRGRGYGRKLVETLIAEAKKQGCYKLVGESRYARERVHALYKGYGFRDHAKFFRLDLLDSKPKQKS